MSKVVKKILVTGSNGQVGNEIQELAAGFPAFEFVFVDVNELDITQSGNVDSFFQQHALDYCINCAAYTAVDKAETDIDTAERVNVTGVENLMSNCKAHQVKMIHLSTDYVYHNSLNRPLSEDDPAEPKSVYARTKLKGDLVVLQGGGLVIRTSWVYSSFGHNFVKTMLRIGGQRDALGVVFDQIGTPTYARDLAFAILTVIRQVEDGQTRPETLSGVYHYSNEGVASWYDFAKAIFEVRQMPVKVNPIETADYPLPAPRPPFSVLNKSKFRSAFGLEIPHWKESLVACLECIDHT